MFRLQAHMPLLSYGALALLLRDGAKFHAGKEMKFNSERDAAGVPRDCQHMGFSALEMGRLASEGAYQLTEKKMMGDKEMGVVRHILTALGGVLIYMGYTDEGTWTMVAGSVATMIGFVWSWMAKA